jgi:hypothetical protein
VFLPRTVENRLAEVDARHRGRTQVVPGANLGPAPAADVDDVRNGGVDQPGHCLAP